MKINTELVYGVLNKVAVPRARWICGTIAGVISIVRILGLPSYHTVLFNDLVYGVWFFVVAVGLFLTADKPWKVSSRVFAAIGAGAFVMLGTDVIGKSITSGIIPYLLAYRLSWEALKSWRI